MSRADDRPTDGRPTQSEAIRGVLAGHQPVDVVAALENLDQALRAVAHAARLLDQCAGSISSDAISSGAISTDAISSGALAPGTAGAAAPLEIRCFGGFRLRRGPAGLDCGAVRPKVRSLLQLLAIHAPSPVHRERLLDALWPDLGVPAGIRNLQVAVSQVRAFLEPDAGADGRQRLRRDGESYRLALLPGDRCDVREFESAVQAWKRVRGTGMPQAVVGALRTARAWYGGDLLPEAGPAEWVVGERLRLRAVASDVLGALAETELGLGRVDAASEAARSSLELDAYRDSSWRVLIAAHQEAGSHAAAYRVRCEYERILRTLEA